MPMSRETVAIATAVVLLAVSTTFVCFRLAIRFFMVRAPGKDDLFCFVAMVFNVLETISMFYEIKFGGGKHIWQLSPDDIRSQLLAVFISQPPYILCLAFVKFSILCQYRRVFSSFVRRICLAMQVFVGVFTIVFCFLFAFQCTPVKGFWDVNARQHCYDLGTVQFIFVGMNVATDLVLLAIPMPIFRSMKLRKAEKRSLIIIFALGGFSAVTCLLRIPYIILSTKSLDSTYQSYGLIIWSRVELSVAIFCACLPALRIPLARWFPKVWRRSSEILSSRTHRSTYGGGTTLNNTTFNTGSTPEMSEEDDFDLSGLSKLKRANHCRVRSDEHEREDLNVIVGGNRQSDYFNGAIHPTPPDSLISVESIHIFTVIEQRIETRESRPTSDESKGVPMGWSEPGNRSTSRKPGSTRSPIFRQRSSPAIPQAIASKWNENRRSSSSMACMDEGDMWWKQEKRELFLNAWALYINSAFGLSSSDDLTPLSEPPSTYHPTTISWQYPQPRRRSRRYSMCSGDGPTP
ncbi:uncharacterized protein BDZ99DRAFT_73700 [Mytilinidion resinicola]|uniref:Rhodopsin domain-containing protein n=1 Tax=Mytilinidion resinicola TaxID=574789 RepID=A0A6A6YEC7_9PEZI|nr:uncharacterized protein BDZ99DRAFT_73700 [Mytilinidion resinicola]KAF2807090.1 hypothetical protein BDZ99DRAFT_73700 [Mytilinidion resinicola]